MLDVPAENASNYKRYKKYEEMIYETANKIAIRLKNKQYISSEEADIISYGLFTLASKCLYCIICLILSFLFNCLIEGVCFYFAFLFIKKYAGGFHAKTEKKCFIASTLSITISVMLICISKKIEFVEFLLLGTSIVSYFLIAVYSPCSSEEKSLSEAECKRFSLISKLRIVFLVVLSLIFIFLNFSSIAVSISIAVILESYLLISGKINNKHHS